MFDVTVAEDITLLGSDMTFENHSANDFNVAFLLPLPTTRGGKKLYVDAYRVWCEDADADDYMNQFVIYGDDGDGSLTLINNDATNKKSQGSWTDTITAHDCSGYQQVFVYLTLVSTTSGQLNFNNPFLRCYYDD